MAAAILICPPKITTQTKDQVLINVTVTTEKGDAILDLNSANFSVNVDNRPQNILSFNGEVPVSVGIVIDASANVEMYGPKSVAEQARSLKVGLERLLKLSHPDNEYFLMLFHTQIAVVRDWMKKTDSFTDRLDQLEFKNQAALYDAISKAVPKVMEGRHAKHALVVFSTGYDTHSKATYKDVREALKRSNVVFYSIAVVNTSANPQDYMGQTGAYFLDELARNSGGRTLISNTAWKSEAFTKHFEAIALELRSQYQLTISSETSDGKDKWRKLNVTATRNDPSGKPQKLIVRTRQGYYR